MEREREDKGGQRKDGVRKMRKARENADQDWGTGAVAGLAVTDVKVGYSFSPAQPLAALHCHILAEFPGVSTLMRFTAASLVLSITK